MPFDFAFSGSQASCKWGLHLLNLVSSLVHRTLVSSLTTYLTVGSEVSGALLTMKTMNLSQSYLSFCHNLLHFALD